MRLVYVTAGDNGLYGLRHMRRAGIEIALVVTISASVAAQARVAGYADVTGFCREHAIPVVVLNDYALAPAHLGEGQFDLLLVNGWNRLIGEAVLARFRLGGLGIHAGHPPIGLGRAPLVWNILKGYRDIEVYVFRLTPRADDGDIVASRTVEITAFDDARTLYEKVMFCGAQLFEQAIGKGATGGFRGARRQNAADAVYYPKRGPADGALDFSQSVEELHNFIRAQSRPYPGAFAYLDGEQVHIWRAAPFDTFAFRDVIRVPGSILAALPSGIVLQTGTSPLWILEASRGGRSLVPAPLPELEGLVGRRFGPKRD